MKNFELILKRFGALVCALKGHRRGKRFVLDGDTDQALWRFSCVRCGATWTRKMRKAKAGE